MRRTNRCTATILLALILVLPLAACGSDEEEPTATPTTAATATPVPVATDLPTRQAQAAEETATTSPLQTPDSPLPTSVAGAEAGSPLPTPRSLPEPAAADRAVVAGELYSIVFDQVIPGTAFYFTKALGENEDTPPTAYAGADLEKGDVRGASDDPSGTFVIDDMPPGNYFLVVWAPYSWVIAVEDEETMTPQLFTFEEGEKYDLGRLLFDWPN